jgi:hypothetical protein
MLCVASECRNKCENVNSDFYAYVKALHVEVLRFTR